MREGLTNPRLTPWATRLRPLRGLTYSTSFWDTTLVLNDGNGRHNGVLWKGGAKAPPFLGFRNMTRTFVSRYWKTSPYGVLADSENCADQRRYLALDTLILAAAAHLWRYNLSAGARHSPQSWGTRRQS